jgi:hypothetical protein
LSRTTLREGSSAIGCSSSATKSECATKASCISLTKVQKATLRSLGAIENEEHNAFNLMSKEHGQDGLDPLRGLLRNARGLTRPEVARYLIQTTTELADLLGISLSEAASKGES